MTLYSYWRSTTSYRVRAALNLKGVSYNTRPVDLLAGDQHDPHYAALNPSHGVPVLELDDGTVLTQSLAILDYLDAIHPTPPLLPAEPLARARVMAAAHVLAVDVHPINNLRVVRHLRDVFDIAQDQIQDWMQRWMTEGLTAIETMIGPKTDFCFGATPDLADICLTAQVYNARRWGIDLSFCPKVQRVDAACQRVDAIAAAHPDQQPDAA